MIKIKIILNTKIYLECDHEVCAIEKRDTEKLGITK